MPNRSYLCGTDKKLIHPSFQDSNYDSSVQTIVNDVYGVPFLWMGMFRERDIVSQEFETEDGILRIETPLVERSVAISQLKESTDYFCKLFEKEGPIGDYVSFLIEVLSSVSYTYVTIEMDEIAYASDPDEFYSDFRKALKGIGVDYSDDAKIRIFHIAAIESLERIPPATLLLEDLEDFEKEDYWNHCRIIGAGQAESGIGRVVPWE